jgi:uncharacterized protein
LRDLGFYDVRVRHHELGATTPLHLARIEVGSEELSRLLDQSLTAEVTQALKKIGYSYVTVDLQGYRRGSLNPQSAATKNLVTDQVQDKV